MAGVSGLRAQFENPKLSPSIQRPPPKPATSSPVRKRKDGSNGTKDGFPDGSSNKPLPQKLSKGTLKNIGKSISQGSPSASPNTETKKAKMAKGKTTDGGLNKGDSSVSEHAVAALAGVIKGSPQGPKLSVTSLTADRSSTSSSFQESLNLEHQMERSGEYIPTIHANGNVSLKRNTQQSPIPRTDSETRKQKALSTPFPSNSLRIDPNEMPRPLSPTERSPMQSKPPPIRPKPNIPIKKTPVKKPPITPKPIVPVRPRSLQPSLTDKGKVGQRDLSPSKDPMNSINPITHTSSSSPEAQVIKEDGSSNVMNNISQRKATDSPDGIAIEVFDEVTFTSDDDDDLLSSFKESSVQSQADVTPKEDVGGCKRSNADSGFQEEESADQDDKSKTKVEEPLIEWDAEKMEKSRKKRHNIALELLETEKSYVDHLKIIAVDLRQCVSSLNVKANKPVVPDSTMNMIFLNIGEIFNLNTQLMTDLQKRMDEWESKEQIADVVNSFAPFLKLYSMYTARFEDSMKILTETMSREKKLDAAVKDFERKIGSGLGVAHYMLEPVQRIPRYKLLLTEYLKYLPQSSSERPSAEKALAVIAEAADKTNNRIKELENSNEILAIERSISDYEGSLLQAHRRFLKKGILQKLSRKTQTPRMFFLFSDIFLHTEVTSPSTFKFKDEIPLCGMRLEVPKVSLVQHSFEIMGTNRAFILSASCEEEKDEWMSVLYSAINDDKEKRKSIKRDQTHLMTVDRSEFGSSAPIMVPDQNVSQCQLCSKDFTFTFRRHHCRACGRVVCGNCSPFKAYLSYSKKEERICAVCDEHRKQPSTVDEDVVDGPIQSPMREQPVPRSNVPSILLVDPKDREEEAIMEGYVYEIDGKKSVRCWYMLGKNLALYKFRAHEDIRATATLPIPGYNIKQDVKTLTITVSHPTSKKKCHNLKFKIESKEEFDSWFEVITKATQLEVAESVSRDHSPAYLSPIHTEADSSSPEKKRSQSLSDLLSNDDHNDLEISV